MALAWLSRYNREIIPKSFLITLSEEWLIASHPMGSAREPQALGAQGAYLRLEP